MSVFKAQIRYTERGSKETQIIQVDIPLREKKFTTYTEAFHNAVDFLMTRQDIVPNVVDLADALYTPANERAFGILFDHMQKHVAKYGQRDSLHMFFKTLTERERTLLPPIFKELDGRTLRPGELDRPQRMWLLRLIHTAVHENLEMGPAITEEELAKRARVGFGYLFSSGLRKGADTSYSSVLFNLHHLLEGELYPVWENFCNVSGEKYKEGGSLAECIEHWSGTYPRAKFDEDNITPRWLRFYRGIEQSFNCAMSGIDAETLESLEDWFAEALAEVNLSEPADEEEA